MRFPSPLESRMYGNPERIAEENQARAANAAKRAAENPPKRRTLHVREEWSEARKAAERLFDFARGGAVSADHAPALPASGSRPGVVAGKNT